MSRCAKNPAKHRRVSKGHGKNSVGGPLSPHALPLKKHAWVGHGNERHCEHCKKQHKQTTGAVIINPPYWVDSDYQKKMAKRRLPEEDG